MHNLAHLYEVEWYVGPLHPPSLAKNLPTRKNVFPLTDEHHPAWNKQKNAIPLQDLQFQSTCALDSKKKKDNR